MILVVFVSYSYFILPMPKVFIKKLKNLKLFYQNSIRSLLKYSTTYLQDVKLELKQL